MILALAVPAAFGQFATMQSPLDGTTPVIDQPVSPDGVYHLSGFDTVSIPSGHLNFALPLVNIPGRGAAKTVAELRIGSSWKVISVPIPNCNQGSCSYTYSYAIVFGPWYSGTIGDPTYAGALMIARGAGDACDGGQTNNYFANSLARLTYIKEDGSETEFRDTATGGQPHANYAPGAFSRGTTFKAFDGSSSVFTASAAVSDPGSCSSGEYGVSGVLTTRDGTQHTFASGYEVKTEDRNGNQLCLSSDCATSGSAPNQTITDSYGRTTTVSECVGCSDTIVYLGYLAASRTVTIKHASLCGTVSGLNCSSGSLLRGDYNGTLSSYSQMFGATSLCTQNVLCTTTAFNPNDLVSEVDLPDGTAYKFFYNTFGDLAEVDLPTGGSYQYDYSLLAQGTGSPTSPYNYTIARLVTAKRVYAGVYGSALEQKITYTAPESGSTTVTFTDGSGNALGTESHTYTPPNSSPNVNGTQYPGWTEGLETQITYTDSSSNLLKTEVDAWQQRACPGTGNECWFTAATGGVSGCSAVNNAACPAHDPQLLSDQTAYNTVTAQNSYLYDLYNNKIQVTESAFGNATPGSVSRTTTTSYETGSAYLGLNILNLPLVEAVYSGTTSGTLNAQTTWNYDEAARVPVACGGIIKHDSAYGTSYTTRGNATSVSRYVSASSSLTTDQTFDIAGNMTESVDPRNVETDYAFSSSATTNTCTLPLVITHYPAVGKTTPTFTELFSYDYSVGKAVSYTDFNSEVTSYAYSDPFERLTNVTRPDASQTNYAYTDTPLAFSVVSKLDQTTAADGLIVATVNYDGIGRKSQSSYTAPEGVIATCYTYDGKNRLASVSNPGECTAQLTAYTYDVLDRVLSITAPDTSVTSYVYHGDTSTLTNGKLEIDPIKNNHLYYSDAQGRLVRVDENATAWQGNTYGQSGQTTYTTTYGYDANDDLLSVTQGSESRGFSYDGLKRLLTATNPENGTLTYTYDASNNLASRTDGRTLPGVSPSTYYIASYSYDGLNRLTAKTYNDSVIKSPYVPTPWVALTYDQGGASANANGRLTETFANYVEYTRGYDSRGRVTTSAQIDGGGTYIMFYGYNLANALTSFTFPSGRVEYLSYDIANRASQASDNFNSLTRNLASTFSYWPDRNLKAMTLGNGLVESTTENNRLQVTGRTATVGSRTQLQLTFTYGTAGANNGNITAQQIQTSAGLSPPPGVNVPALNLTDTYTTDAYNRILKASESGTSWTQNYLYDAFGNRAVQAGGYNTTSATPTAVSQFNAKNQWTSAGFDAAGDATSVPGATTETFSYDGEYRAYQAYALGTINYIYDGEGRRVQKASSVATTNYVYDTNGETVAEYTGQAQPFYGTAYLTEDHLGSTRMETDGAAEVIRRYDYLPFGEEVPSGEGGRGGDYGSATYPTTPDVASRKFTGKERDSETGLDYFGARYFSAAQGRFTSADWAAKPEAVPYANLEDPQTLNLYGYVRNNPLAKSDKDGHGELQPLDSQQMQSVQSDMAALNQFTVEHPILTNLLLNVGMAILSRGEAGPGGRVESSEGTGGGVPEAPTMRSGQREAMRQENIPTSQQPTTQTNTPAGRQYEYDVPKPGGGTTAKVVQRNNGTDSSHPGELHVEAGTPKPGKPTPTDSIGRPRLDSNKTKVNVKKPDGN